ncbi:hypothetical protein LCGC14_1997910 [marine sediment metagenome]|uniref:Ice-binding protein C-terminal domain-containing protein n=1 Tax=marine sediment metagenome TaxID=412755 RepID=A0A0F9I161_9ZZZZ
MKDVIISIIVVYGLSFCALEAEATLITIEIEAVVDSVEDSGDGDGYLEGNIEVGDIIIGTYIYDSDMPYTILPEYGHWYTHTESPYGMFLSVGDVQFETDPENVNFTIGVKDDCQGAFDTYYDEFRATSYNNLPLDTGISVSLIEWELLDFSTQALSNMDLPLTAPILADWDFNRLSISGETNSFRIDSHVTSAVPEPGTIVLLGIGGLMLARRNRRG